MEIYRKKVANLRASPADPTAQTDALEILRSLIERVSVRHGHDGFTIERAGEIANIVEFTPPKKNPPPELGRRFRRCSVVR
jgi:hypothetical protein